jgi:capsular exopolysaccharide synthesis family protein
MAASTETTKADWLQPPLEEEGLRRYIETIRQRWLVVLGTVVLTTAMAIFYVLLASKTYEAQADLLITPVSADDPVQRSLPLIIESIDPTRDVETASQFVTNTEVAARAKQELDLEQSPRDLLRDVTAEPVAQSNIVAITATGSSPEEARDLADAIAKATVEDRTERVHSAIKQVLPTYEAQLAASSGTAADTLAAQVAQLEALLASPDPSIRIEAEADLPNEQASPRPLLSIAGGLVAGLVLGIAGAFALQNLDPRLRRESQLRRLYRLPILGRIPRETGRGAGREPLGPQRLSPFGAEAYRSLRTTLEASRVEDSGSRVILVTGSSAGEGKSTTAANLASSLALAGKRVILIEADLRRPVLGMALEMSPAKGGVVGVLVEGEKLEEALNPSPTYGDDLRVLLADYQGGWVPELFSIPAAREMIEDARGLADYVVIDSPPLNEVADAMPLARQADDVLIVVRLGKTRLQRIAQLGELLAENGIRPVGFTVVGVPRPARGDYHYYQGGDTAGRQKRLMFGAGSRVD